MVTASQADLVKLGHDYLYQNYRQPPIVLSRGRGVEVWDVEGQRYLDFMAGIAVNALGHAHPHWVRAIAEQAGQLTHVSNYFFNEPNVRLAQKLCQRTGFARAFFCNSGAEAIEASLKLARRAFFERNQPDRHRVLAFRQSFHGRTMGALAATGQAAYREGFGPLGSVSHVDFGDVTQVRAALASDVAAILVEPIQGEGGVVPAKEGFLAALRELADESGALLVFDEIQTGIGRTGRFLACEHSGVRPDIVALAKGLGGGIPIGAMLCTQALEGVLPPGSHGSTFGGNPLASAGALATLEVLEKEDLLKHVVAMGDDLVRQLQRVAAKHPTKTKGVRGLGLLQGLVLGDDVDPRGVLTSARDNGLLLTIAGSTTLRFSPPLVVESKHITEATGIIDAVLGAAP
jgi:acetylornithine/N-succinyldiaminopimelate aminotransferase